MTGDRSTAGSERSSHGEWVGRRGVIHLVPPGLRDRAARGNRSLGRNLTAIVKTALAGSPVANQVEVLLVPGNTGYTCCVHVQTTLIGDSDAPEESVPVASAGAGTAAAVEAIEEYLPDIYGVETGDLWLQPLTAGNSVTCRAVETASDWSPPTSMNAFHAIRQWTRHNDRGPLVYQLLIREAEHGGYRVTLRAMQIGRRPPVRQHELGAVLENGIQSPLIAGLPDEVQSARQLVADYWEAIHAPRVGDHADRWHPTLGWPTDTDELRAPAAIRSRDVLTSHSEAAGLLTAAPLEDHYTPFQVSPWLSVSSQGLAHLLNFFPLPRSIDWATDASSPPRLDRERVIRTPTATDRTAVLPTPSVTGWRERPVNQSFIDTATAWLFPNTSEIHDWETPTDPAHVIGESPVLDGRVLFVDRDASLTDVPAGTAAEIVGAANAAVVNGDPLWLITSDSATAKWAIDVLRHPVRDGRAASAEPYKFPMVWGVVGGVIPLADKTATRDWRITPNGTWELLVNGELRAHGPIGRHEEPAELDLPRLIKNGDGFDLHTVDGEVRGRYDAITDLDGVLLPIKQPRSPRWVTFADRATVLYQDGGTLRPAWKQPTWSASRTRYFENAVQQFLTTHVTTRSGDLPPARDVEHWFVRYYRGQANYSLSTLDYQDLADVIGTATERTADGSLVLPRRSWRFQPRTTHDSH